MPKKECNLAVPLEVFRLSSITVPISLLTWIHRHSLPFRQAGGLAKGFLSKKRPQCARLGLVILIESLLLWGIRSWEEQALWKRRISNFISDGLRPQRWPLETLIFIVG